MGLSHVYHPDGFNKILLSQGSILEKLLLGVGVGGGVGGVGRGTGETHIPRMGEGKES